jgi:hypothetical protein
MMDFSLLARFIGRIRGISVVAVVGIVGMVLLARTNINNDWLKFAGFIICALPVAGAAYRGVRGTEEGPLDLELTRERETLRIFNMPQAAAGSLLQAALQTYATRRRPLPRPKGTIHGSPANQENLTESEAAALPPTIQVMDQAPELPPDAATLE